jgi:hypothetical protein
MSNPKSLGYMLDGEKISRNGPVLEFGRRATLALVLPAFNRMGVTAATPEFIKGYALDEIPPGSSGRHPYRW